MLIYLIRNTVNGKGYVGQTIRTLAERWNQHKQQGIHRYKNDALHNALLKYGFEAFEIAVLDDTPKTLDELNNLETFHIAAQRTLSPHGYNLTTGGFSYQRSAETLAKMSASMKGRKRSIESIAKTAAANKGRVFSPERRSKISAALKGNQHTKGLKRSPESYAKVLQMLNSPENKLKRSVSLKSDAVREKLRNGQRKRRERELAAKKAIELAS